MFFDSEVEIYYDLLKNDQILLQCSEAPNLIWYAAKNKIVCSMS
jgi:hypothetical protein